jgi:hypothetical protein
MSKKLPLKDFRAVRSKLEPHEFAISEGQDVPPSDLVDPAVWHGIMHLPEDVSIRISDHNGLRLRLMYQFWGDWVEAIGDPNNPDEIFNCLLEAADCFQGTTFNFLHGFHRTALAELRTALAGLPRELGDKTFEEISRCSWNRKGLVPTRLRVPRLENYDFSASAPVRSALAASSS